MFVGDIDLTNMVALQMNAMIEKKRECAAYKVFKFVRVVWSKRGPLTIKALFTRERKNSQGLRKCLMHEKPYKSAIV